jgi:tetratricopeptide (TPR) repeat protein
MTASTGNIPGRIFMSYRREDTAYPAGWLYDRLAGHFGRGQVFKDIDSIGLGDDFVEVINTAVESCDVLLALIGDRWLTVTGQDGRRRLDNPGDFVRLEIEAALTRNVRVIPILVEGARMPHEDELPASLAKLARRQALELSPSRFDDDAGRLLRVLGRTISEAQEQARQRAEEEAARRRQQVEQLEEQIRERAAAAFAQRPTIPGSVEWDLFQLPPDIADFTGREDESARVRKLLEGASATATTVTIIAGQGGIGKTTLAIHEAHKLRHRFPDGQLYVNLRGAEDQRLDPFVVLGEFLIVLGLERSALPEGREDRARLYRARLDTKKILVVLDNAFDEEQVRSLIPGSASSAVLITSRSRLDGLAGSHLVELGVLETSDAVSLLAKIAGSERVHLEPAAAEELSQLCGRLPLAVRIAGAKLRARPDWPVAKLAQRLYDEKYRLGELKAGDLEVRSCFTVGYTGLDEETKRAFRLLGVLNLPDFPSWVAGPLFGTTSRGGSDWLERLVNAQLVERSIGDALGQDRYRIHDLLRLFAREKIAQEETESVTSEALQCTLGMFLAFAEFANSILGPADILKYVPPESKLQRIEDEETKKLIKQDPLGWLGTERLNYIVAVEQAYDAGYWELTWRLAIALAHFFDTHCHWSDWEHTHELAWKATQELHDLTAEAYVLDGLGITLGYQNQFDKTNQYKKRALDILRELGDQYGEAYVLRGLGMAYFNQNRFDEALNYLQASLSLFEELEQRPGPAQLQRSYVNGHAYDLHSIGQVYQNQGRLDDATNALEQGRSLFYQLRGSTALQQDQPAADRRKQLGANEGLGLVLSDLGELYRTRAEDDGARVKAAGYLNEALGIFRDLGNTFREARVLQRLGKLYSDRGNDDQALDTIRESLLLFQAVGSRRGQADAWRSLGEVYLAVNDLERAREAFDQSLILNRQADDRLGEARTLTSLGALLQSSGDSVGAANVWHTALKVFEELGTMEAGQVRAFLANYSKHE